MREMHDVFFVHEIHYYFTIVTMMVIISIFTMLIIYDNHFALITTAMTERSRSSNKYY